MILMSVVPVSEWMLISSQQRIQADGCRGRILWVEAKRVYTIALQDDRLATRNAQGGPLASAPRWLKDSE